MKTSKGMAMGGARAAAGVFVAVGLVLAACGGGVQTEKVGSSSEGETSGATTSTSQERTVYVSGSLTTTLPSGVGVSGGTTNTGSSGVVTVSGGSTVSTTIEDGNTTTIVEPDAGEPCTAPPEEAKRCVACDEEWSCSAPVDRLPNCPTGTGPMTSCQNSCIECVDGMVTIWECPSPNSGANSPYLPAFTCSSS